MRTELVVDALQMAMWRRQPDAGTIMHSDRGSHRNAPDFQRESILAVVSQMCSHVSAACCSDDSPSRDA